jgi:hypothetical protein
MYLKARDLSVALAFSVGGNDGEKNWNNKKYTAQPLPIQPIL